MDQMGMDDLLEQKYRVNMLSYYLEVQANLTSTLGRPPTVDEWACSLNLAVCHIAFRFTPFLCLSLLLRFLTAPRPRPRPIR